MSVWIQNLKTRLEDRPVVILHGNVRDRYIDEYGRVYDNLTTLLTEVARQASLSFSELVFYDSVGGERRVATAETLIVQEKAPEEDAELAATAPGQRLEKRGRPTQVLEQWKRQLSAADLNRFVVLFYLDKLVAYKTSYHEDEKEILLRLEKVIENIAPNHRLVLVALQDTMVPTELYTHSPKTVVLPIPAPDKVDRLAYLKHRLGSERPHLELVADLTDGLFLRDLDNIVAVLHDQGDQKSLGNREIRRLVNRYRIGEEEDYWSTLSIEKLDQDEALRWFVEEEGVKGQEEAILKVIDTLCVARAGLSGMASGVASKPKGVLFFAGPTGVGKTFTAKKLAKFLFGTEEAFLRFDMSEFKEEHTVSKLIGSPPGYVGYEQGGALTNAVREKPFSVILFDEIEKAHPRIMDIFLQILGDGRLTDSRGQTVFFTETVIIFTSNLGSDAIVGISDIGDKEKKREHFTKAVEHFFTSEISRPELLNRIGNNIVPFNFIHTLDVQEEIVSSHLRRIKEDFEDRYRSVGHCLTFDASVARWLVQKHSQQIRTFGGAGITNIIQDKVMAPLAYAVLRAEYEDLEGGVFHVSASDEKVVVEEEHG